MGKTEINKDKVDLVQHRVKRKTRIWLTFIFFGWSYGSLGNIGAQILWYAILFITAFGLYQNLTTSSFTLLTSMALVGLPITIVWGVFRLATLNKAIDQYNEGLANIFGLNEEERELLDI
jgi:Na+/H+-dicarboxylate symporter